MQITVQTYSDFKIGVAAFLGANVKIGFSQASQQAGAYSSGGVIELLLVGPGTAVVLPPSSNVLTDFPTAVEFGAATFFNGK